MRNVQRLITIGCVLIGLLVLVGTVSAFFSPAIQAALTVPPSRTNMPASGVTHGAIPTAASTKPPLTITMTASSPSPTMVPAMNLLAQDTFQRNDQQFWGTASDGQAWGGDAKTLKNFSITGHMGVVVGGQGVFDATLGPRVTDADVVFSGSLSLFGNGTSNIGSVLRWTDANNWYKAYIDGTQLILLKKVTGTVTRLNAVAFTAQNGIAYTLRIRIVGTMLSAKAWLVGQAEPATWMVIATDAALPSGFGGLRLVVQNGAVAKITMFTEMLVPKNP